MLQMILQNHLAGIVDRGAHGGDLNQYLRAIAPFLDHSLDRLQMTDRARQAVENGFRVFVRMRVAVRVGNAQRVQRLVIQRVIVIMHVLVFVVHGGFTLQSAFIVNGAGAKCNMASRAQR